MSSGGDAGDAAGGRDGATFDALLRPCGWLRRLAGSLVVDAAAAADLAQQALLVVLEQPSAHAVHPRSWLATVARRLGSARQLARHDLEREGASRRCSQQPWFESQDRASK